MSHVVLLYGATGYSGRLITAEAALRDGGPFSMILGGRDNEALAELGRGLDMEHRAFALDDPATVAKNLAGVDVVINAAGPFDVTAPRLARSAIGAGVHYVDINGEIDVYKKLEAVGRHATDRGVAMVCSAGHSAAASNLVLYVALAQIRSQDFTIDKLGAVRIALSRLTTLSRGSVLTLVRSIREQVAVVRMGQIDAGDGNVIDTPVLWHEPVGKLERVFDFGPDDQPLRPCRTATAANVVDTLTAWLTVQRSNFTGYAIESYVEAAALERLAYQASSLFTPLAATPWARDVARMSVASLPPGPTASERAAEQHTIVLEIEGPDRVPLINWRWHTPNPYDFTARVVVEIAARLSQTTPPLRGWLTPSEVLTPGSRELSPASDTGYLRGCELVVARSADNGGDV